MAWPQAMNFAPASCSSLMMVALGLSVLNCFLKASLLNREYNALPCVTITISMFSLGMPAARWRFIILPASARPRFSSLAFSASLVPVDMLSSNLYFKVLSGISVMPVTGITPLYTLALIAG